MTILTATELAGRSEKELGALVLVFNMALAREKPFSLKWRDARAVVDAVLTERRRRIEQPWPQRFGP
jgi:hypothetical protein